MAGGAPETFERCLPVFEAMGTSITLMGPSGMGQTTKLVNQILVADTCAAVAEALTFAAAQGADLLKTVEAVSGGAAGSWQLANLGPRMAQRDFAPGFMVKLQQKDLRLILEAAQERHVPLAVTAVARQYLTPPRRWVSARRAARVGWSRRRVARAASACGLSCLQRDLPTKSSQYSTLWPTNTDREQHWAAPSDQHGVSARGWAHAENRRSRLGLRGPAGSGDLAH